jgi:hypothetical protein
VHHFIGERSVIRDEDEPLAGNVEASNGEKPWRAFCSALTLLGVQIAVHQVNDALILLAHANGGVAYGAADILRWLVDSQVELRREVGSFAAYQRAVNRHRVVANLDALSNIVHDLTVHSYTSLGN